MSDPASPQNSESPRALLFDLGGVLVDIDFSRALKAWSALSALSADDLQRAFQFDHAYERHERGEMSGPAYFAHLASALRLDATAAQVEAGWNSIFVGEITETRLLVEAARRKLPCYAFTNTNASHMNKWSALYPGVVTAFDKIFASHEIGLRKPEPAAFAHVCQSVGVAPQSMLFFDDSPANVQAAQQAGLRGVLVRTPQDVAAALRAASAA